MLTSPSAVTLVASTCDVTVKLPVNTADGKAKSAPPPEPPVARTPDRPSPGGGAIEVSDTPPGPNSR
jgi:hypothetical protein